MRAPATCQTVATNKLNPREVNRRRAEVRSSWTAREREVRALRAVMQMQNLWTLVTHPELA